MGKLATFRDLTRAELIATFEAASFLLVARILVGIVPLRFWRARFGKITGEGASGDVAAASCPTVKLVRQAVGRAMRNAPLDFICLPQALAARWMLVRRGIDSVLQIGAKREASGPPRFHAWLVARGQWVTGDCEPAEFALLEPEGTATQ